MKETLTPEAEAPGFKPITWSQDGLIMFLDGWAWSALVLDGRVRQVCLGKEDDVRAVLAGARPLADVGGERQAMALASILRLKEETDGAGPEANGLERGRSPGAVRDRPKNTRLSESRKRVSRGKAHRQIKGVSRR